MDLFDIAKKAVVHHATRAAKQVEKTANEVGQQVKQGIDYLQETDPEQISKDLQESATQTGEAVTAFAQELIERGKEVVEGGKDRSDSTVNNSTVDNSKENQSAVDESEPSSEDAAEPDGDSSAC